MTPDDVASFPWLSPANYHTRCTDAVSVAVASEILLGASWQSATKKYGVRGVALKWMKWGYEAYQRDAGPEDHHAQYLNWFLKLSQAIGTVESLAQQRVFRDSAQWWLLHNPEARADWGDAPTVPSLTEQATEEEADAQFGQVAQVSAPVDTNPLNIRTVVRMLVESGMTVPLPPSATEKTIDTESSSNAEHDGTGTHG